VLLRFWQASLPIHYKEVQSDRGLIGNLELSGRRERVGDVPNISEGLWLENAGAVERRARVDCESVRKRADWPYLVQETQLRS